MHEPWLCFTLDHDEAAALARFETLYQRRPAVIERRQGLLWLGPCTEEEARIPR